MFELYSLLFMLIVIGNFNYVKNIKKKERNDLGNWKECYSQTFNKIAEQRVSLQCFLTSQRAEVQKISPHIC